MLNGRRNGGAGPRGACRMWIIRPLVSLVKLTPNLCTLFLLKTGKLSFSKRATDMERGQYYSAFRSNGPSRKRLHRLRWTSLGCARLSGSFGPHEPRNSHEG